MVCKPAILNINSCENWMVHQGVTNTFYRLLRRIKMLIAHYEQDLGKFYVQTVNHIAITIIRHNKQRLMRKAIWTFDRTIFGSSRDRNFAVPFLKDFSPVRSQRLFSHSFEQVVHKWPRAHDRPTFSVISPSLYSSSSSDSLQKKR